MKSLFFLLTIPLVSCGDYPPAHLPIVAVRPVDNPRTSLTTAFPSSPESLEVSLETLPDAVRHHNLSLAAARKLVTEAEAKLSGSGILGNPELEVEFETNRELGDIMLTVGVSKKFPRTNRLLLEKRVTGILVEAAKAEVRDVERLLIGQAREELIGILALRQESDLIIAQKKNALVLTESIEAAAAVGEASALDAGVALLEGSRLGNLADQVEIRKQLALAQLKPILGMKPEGNLIVTGDLPQPSLPPMNVTSYRRPDLEAARLRATSAGAETDLARATRLDDIEAGIFAGVGTSEHPTTGVEGEQIIGVRFKIPLGDNPLAASREAEANARLARLRLGAESLAHIARSETETAYAEMKQWQLLAGQMKDKILPLAESQIEKTQAAYQRAEVPLRDVLRAREQKLTLETSYLEAVRDFHLAYAKYLTATAR